MDIYDAIIVGGGPAGISAAIYCRRKLLKCLVISKDVGGQVMLAGEIENYLGYTGRSGMELADLFEMQAKRFDVKILLDEVVKVEKKDELFLVKGSNGEWLTKTAIITGGSAYRLLNVPGEEALIGRGVSVCATCDAPFANGKVVAVVGGGNTALQSAELLAKYAKTVYLIHRKEDFRADEMICERAKGLTNIIMLMNSWVSEIKGSRKVESVIIKDLRTGGNTELKLDMLFIEIGRIMKLDYVKDLLKTNQIGQIMVDREQRTSCPGIFAAGDITDRKYGQAIIAAGDGAIAALSAYDYIKEAKTCSV